MKVSDIFRRSENQVNTVPDLGVSRLINFFGSRSGKKFADAYYMLVFKQIFSGIRNVNFKTTKNVVNPTDQQAIEKITNFIETNANLLLWWWWNKGYIVIGVDANHEYYVPGWNDVQTDGRLNVEDYDIVMYSDTYQLTGKSDMMVLKENVSNIDTLKNAETYLTSSLGALAIMSGKEMGMQPKDKKEFLDRVKKDYGITEDKYQILIMSSAVDVKQITLPIKELELGAKIREEIKLIAGYFQVPYDLIPFSGASTYANQEQAIINFYRNCISPLAEVLLSVARYMLKRIPGVLVPSEYITFSIDNVTELEDDRTADIEYKLKVVDLVAKMRAEGLDATEYEEQLKMTK